MPFFNNHTHTMYSNIRLLDSTNRPEKLIDKAIEMGMTGIAITDHEALCSHVVVNKYTKKLRKENPDFNFTVALGNEIYLVENRENGQKYYHFILIAKDKIGYRALKELSSIAWINSYYDRGLERVPLLKEELKKVMKDYKGHVIATTACIGGELGQTILKLNDAEHAPGAENIAREFHNQIVNFVEFCIDVFGKDDFYLECAPSSYPEQILVNKRILKISQAFGLKMCVGTDAHYLTKEDRFVHKSYLNSKGGEREVDAFYEFARLMEENEVIELLSLAYDEDVIKWIFDCSEDMRKKIEFYDLELAQKVVEIPVIEYPIWPGAKNLDDTYPILKSLFLSENVQERYWINECWMTLEGKRLNGDIRYVERLEQEAKVIKEIGNNLNCCLFSYFNTFKHYIDLFWECGSIVGPGRGSACGFLSNYLLGITQLDPIKWDLAWWRFLNPGRIGLPDIDIDLDPTVRPKIFEKIREERGPLGLVQVCTFGKENTKSCILTACRGYRSKDYPDGIDVDEAQYLSSLVPSERGFNWKLSDVVYGNAEKGRKPVNTFINAVNNYPGLLDIMLSIEGLVKQRGIHASGVILYDNDPYETACFMKAPSGDIITQYDLEDAEYCGDTKYDFLVTEITTKLAICLKLLQEKKEIPMMSLREAYNKYLHPDALDTTNSALWDHLIAGDVLDVFQFNESSGLKIAKKLQPRSPVEMMTASAMMRLMSDAGQESQADRYVRIKQNPKSFEQEMEKHHLPEEMKQAMHKYCDEYNGCCAIQEQMMQILMDNDIAHFSLEEADAARKVIAKKKMDKLPTLKNQVFEKIGNTEWAQYIWDTAVLPQAGYAFNRSHSLPYSFVGIQTLFLATSFNPIYWNTSCLIVNSGAANNTDNDSTDYSKIAKAIGEIRNAGIKVSLVDINHSDFGFKPDVENDQILFGLKGLQNVGDDLIRTIIECRPYQSMVDFYYRVNPNKQAMIALIKGGAFDQFKPRKRIMAEYLWLTCDKKRRLTLQNMPGLIRYGLLPEDTDEQIMARRIFEFNRYLKAQCRGTADFFALDSRAIDFLNEIDKEELIENGFMDKKIWDKKVYQPWMDIFRAWIDADREEILTRLNTKIFFDDWQKYAQGNISAWEMESSCFYYHDHELANVDYQKYGFSDFFSLDEEPEIERILLRGQNEIPLFKIRKICGTCIAKNKIKSTVYLLTREGVVPVKFRQEYFSLFDKQISERQEDGTKKILEKSWFNRGNMIVVQGVRREGDFIAKKYNSTPGHTIYHIDEVLENGELILRSERRQGIEENDE